MAWQIEFTPEAEKQLAKIDRQSAKRITNFLRERIAAAENPRSLGKALKGVLREFWRYRWERRFNSLPESSAIIDANFIENSWPFYSTIKKTELPFRSSNSP